MKTFYEIMYDWVKENFGEGEAKDPSWNIGALADRLADSTINPNELNAETKVLVYDDLKDRYLEQDIEEVARDKGITLTEDDITDIKHKYYKLDDETWTQLSVIMDDMEGE